MYQHDADGLRLEIERLLWGFPELADDEILRADMLDGSTNISEVLTTLVRGIEDAKALKSGTQERLEELKSRGERFALRIDFLRALIQKILDAADLRKIELAEATLALRNNPPQIVGSPIADQLPDDLCRIKREPDKTKIKQALLDGRDVPGCVLGNAPPSVMVKIK